MRFPRLRTVVIATAALICSAAVTIAAIGPTHLLGEIGRVLVVREEVREGSADAIIVLLGQGRRDRTDRAIELFREGTAPRVAFIEAYRDRPLFGMKDLTEYPLRTEGHEYKRLLLEGGVPEEALVMIPTDQAYDTATELSSVIRWMRGNSHKRAVIVTSASHSRRVSLVWKRLATDLEGYIVGSGRSSMDEWWLSRGKTERVVYEYGGLVKEAVRWILSGSAFGLFMKAIESSRETSLPTR